MAFTGQRYLIALTGSYNGNKNTDEVPVGDFITTTLNIDTHNGVVEPRGGTVNVSQVSALSAANTTVSLGGGCLVKRNSGSKHLYMAAGSVLYRDGTSVKTGRSTTARVHFTPTDDKMFICNGVDAVQVDTGSAIADIATPPADWTGSTHPVKCVLHAKGNSQRLFFWGVPGKEDTLYYSVSGDYEDMTSAGSGNIKFACFDGFGIIDCVSKDGVLRVMGRDRTAYLDDDDASPANWGYQLASYRGGVHSPRLTCVAGNYIFAMTTEGEIYEVHTAETTGNINQASISEPFFIHHYLKDQIDMSQVDNFHMVYDPKVRGVRVFLSTSSSTAHGQTGITDRCLTWLVNQQKWMPPQTSENGYGYWASCSFEATNSSGQKTVYTQGPNGYTHELNQTSILDVNASGSTSVPHFITPAPSGFDLEGMEKRFVRLRLRYKAEGTVSVVMTWSADTTAGTGRVLSLTNSSNYLTSIETPLGEVGETLALSFTSVAATASFQIPYLVVMFVPRGVQVL